MPQPFVLPATAGRIDLLAQAHARSTAVGLRANERPDFSPLSRLALRELLDTNHALFAHARPVMENLHAQIAVGVGQPHLDRRIAVTHRVRDQFADDEFGQVDMPAKSPAWQRFARPLAGMADLRRILVKSEGDGKHADGGQRHSQLQARQ